MEKNIEADDKKVTVEFIRDIYSVNGDVLHRQGESEVFLPVLIQSCMNPDKFTLYPVRTECYKEEGKEYISVSSHTNSEKYNAENVELHFEPYEAFIEKKKCSPCNNCGRC